MEEKYFNRDPDYGPTPFNSPIWVHATGDPDVSDYETVSYMGSPKEAEEPLVPEVQEERVEEVPEQQDNGLTVKGAAMLIAGEMAGSGLLALPYALSKTGWIGVPLMIFICGIATFNGSCIGVCWSILEERHPQLRSKIRNPYAMIAYHATGSYGRLLVSICMKLNLFGTGVVYLLLAAQIIREMLEQVMPSVSLCIWFFIIVLIITPTAWLGSPKDLSFAGVAAFMTTVIATLLMLIQISKDSETQIGHHSKVHNFREFFLAFGSILFAFGGASTFPTIQNDMMDKAKFTHSVIMSCSAILVLYLVLSVSAYLVYGDLVAGNVVLSISPTAYLLVANFLMALHLLFAFLIIINPVCQGVEEIFEVPLEFQWKRCLVRSLLMIGLLFVGLTIPTSSTLIALVGGSTIALLTFMMPAYFYMKICDQEDYKDDVPKYTIPLYKRIILWEIIVVGVVGGTATIYSALVSIFQTNLLVTPCYIPH